MAVNNPRKRSKMDTSREIECCIRIKSWVRFMIHRATNPQYLWWSLCRIDHLAIRVNNWLPVRQNAHPRPAVWSNYLTELQLCCRKGDHISSVVLQLEDSADRQDHGRWMAAANWLQPAAQVSGQSSRRCGYDTARKYDWKWEFLAFNKAGKICLSSAPWILCDRECSSVRGRGCSWVTTTHGKIRHHKYLSYMHTLACTRRAGPNTHIGNQSRSLRHWGEAINLLADSLSMLAWPSHEWEAFYCILLSLSYVISFCEASSSAFVPEMHCVLHCGWCFVE